ncbi:MAG: type II toxin-antitoxin system VapC family toxin [Thermoanaerobaculia bacterium]
MKILLDTSAYSAFKRNDERVVALVRQSEEITFSPIVGGELLAGFRWGARFEKNRDELLEFLAHPRVRLAPLTLTTADRYSRIYRSLRDKGTPIPTNDLWVAAQAMETGAELVSLDRHFALVAGLAWTDVAPPVTDAGR